MKNIFLFLGIWVVFGTDVLASAPDSLWKKVVQRSFADHDEEITFHDKKKHFATLRVFDKKGVLLTETNFKNFTKGIRQGFAKGFYPNGQLYWSADYKNGELSGDFVVYREDGSLKRREVYWTGLRKEKHCYDKDGQEVPFFEFSQDAEFQGGDYALQAYLRTKLGRNKVGSQAELASFAITIQADSTVTLKHYLPNSLLSLNKVVELLKEMPKWLPAREDEAVYEQEYVVNLVFQSGTVHLAHLTPNFAQAFRKNTPNRAATITPFPVTAPRRRPI
jgi:hypothetical protein